MNNMKTATEILSAVTDALGVSKNEINLAEMKLANGTILEAEEFAKGKEVFIKTDEDKVPLPEGLYELEDGKTMVIVDEGIIDDIKDQQPEEVEEDLVDEALKEDDKEEKMAYATREELAEIKTMVEEVKQAVEDMKKHKDEEMAKQDVVIDEVKAENEELKEELSKPATAPIKHNPEAKTETRSFKYGLKRPQSTMDRVFERISNINRKNNN